MSSLGMRATALSFAYDTVRIFSHLDLHLAPGWTGIVGGNGTGKTTLLQLLSGALQPTDGHLTSVPDRLVVSTCPQRVGVRTAAVEAYGSDWSRAAIRSRARLHLAEADLARWGTLSPGERKRWQIGAALNARPDLLLLDEPGNHLDVDGRALLMRALGRFKGIGVLVSHDRALLDQLTTRTIRLHAGSATTIDAPYSAARVQWTRVAAARETEFEAMRSAQRRARRQLADERRAHQQADAARSARKRMSSRADHDARSAGAKKRARAAASKIGRRVGVLRHSQAQLAQRADAIGPPDTQLGRSVTVKMNDERRRVLAQVSGDIRVADRVLVRDARAVVERDSRVWLRGPNGSGKTTLLKAVLRACVVPPERVLALAQDPDGPYWRDQLLALDSVERGAVLNAVAALGVDPDRLLQSEAPSPGETQKLALAFGLTRSMALLALDEPTNHLDMPAIERLQAALAAWPGALVLITHDPQLARACTTTSWQVVDEQLRVGPVRDPIVER